MKRLGILLSGRGSNFEAIARNIQSGVLQAEIVVVISNVPDAPGLETARSFGLKTVSLPSRGVPRAEYDRQVIEILNQHKVDLICLAGFMRILTEEFIRAFPLRILNIHPSLLPAFPGLHAQRQAFEHGVKTAGCTVHFVDEGLDSGPIILQATVPVESEDTEDSLAAKILCEEHRIYSDAIRLVLEGRIEISGRRTKIKT